VEILQRRGEKIFGRTSCINPQMMLEFNLVLVMERGQKEALRVEFPEHASKIYLLSEMVGDICSIEDPSGGGFKDYERTANEIEMYLRSGWNKILVMASR
jgi:protein-tyrosine-phosphatase